ncbi:MAG: hypothetical protein IT564_12070, partial [Rhodospirillales bacterium]|nr:hypothetical protein [Rhodospirillales bacterium]
MNEKKVVQSRNGGNKPAQLTPIGPGEWSVRLRCGNGPRLRYRVRAASEASAAKTVAMMQAAATLLADRPVDALKVLRAIGDAGELEDARACLAVAEKAAKKKAPEPAAMAPQRLTFGQVAGRWTSGALAREYPDHVRVKDGELDAARLDRLGAINVGGVRLRDVAIVEFTLEHAEAAMRGLDAAAG